LGIKGADANGEELLRITQLSCLRNEQEVFSDLTFSISPGMLIHLTGSNGSGKSSLLKMIAGLLPIEKGVVESDFGNNTTKQTLTGLLAEDPNHTANVLYIGHKTGLTLSLSPRENMKLWQSLRCYSKTISTNAVQLQNDAQIDAILAELNLNRDAQCLCEALSAGQKQKVVLCRLWCESAPLWLLDEPFTAIDKTTQGIIEARMQRHLGLGGAIIMANHSEMNLPNLLGKNYIEVAMPLEGGIPHKKHQNNVIMPACASLTISNPKETLERVCWHNTMQIFKAVFKRDIMLYTRRQSETCLPFIFFIMIVSIFSISMGSSTTLLADFAGPILWVGALLSILLSAESLYRMDYESGYLEQLVLNPLPLHFLLFAKMLAHFLGIGLPILIMAPILGIILHLPIACLSALFFSFLIGIPALCFITSIGSAIIVSLQRGGLLLSILLIPLIIPVIIFACSALQLNNVGLPWRGEGYLLMAVLLISALCSPIISAFAIKLGLD
jgi:heme exporter protein B